jgi:hypothetical protein
MFARRASKRHHAHARQGFILEFASREKNGGGRRLTSNDGTSRRRWSIARLGGRLAQSCTMRCTSRMRRNTKRRMREGQHGRFSKKGITVDATLMSGASGDGEGSLAGPQSTPWCSGAWGHNGGLTSDERRRRGGEQVVGVPLILVRTRDRKELSGGGVAHGRR